MNVGSVCKREVMTIDPEATVFEAAQRMRQFHVGNLVVVEHAEGETVPVGIITDRDIVVSMVAEDIPDHHSMLVSDLLSSELITANEAEQLDEVIERMSENAVRRLPVVDDTGRLVGIFTLDDGILFVADKMSGLLGDLVDLARIIHRQRDLEKRVRE